FINCNLLVRIHSYRNGNPLFLKWVMTRRVYRQTPHAHRKFFALLFRLMREPLVSIIIRSFNEAWALRETLPALHAQDYKNWELIVIDSGSTDGSVELIRDAKPMHFVQITHEE